MSRCAGALRTRPLQVEGHAPEAAARPPARRVLLDRRRIGTLERSSSADAAVAVLAQAHRSFFEATELPEVQDRDAQAFDAQQFLLMQELQRLIHALP